MLKILFLKENKREITHAFGFIELFSTNANFNFTRRLIIYFQYFGLYPLCVNCQDQYFTFLTITEKRVVKTN